jgi:hypothetical protein
VGQKGKGVQQGSYDVTSQLERKKEKKEKEIRKRRYGKDERTLKSGRAGEGAGGQERRGGERKGQACSKPKG